MDYAMEYALMSDIYDEMTEANEGGTPLGEKIGATLPGKGFKDYVGSKDGKLAKFGAGVKWVLTRIAQFMYHILTILPRAIAFFVQKIRKKDASGLIGKTHIMKTEAVRQAVLHGTHISKAIKDTTKKGNEFIKNLETGEAADEFFNQIKDDCDSIYDEISDTEDAIKESAESIGTGPVAGEVIQAAIGELGKTIQDAAESVVETAKKIKDGVENKLKEAEAGTDAPPSKSAVDASSEISKLAGKLAGIFGSGKKAG